MKYNRIGAAVAIITAGVFGIHSGSADSISGVIQPLPVSASGGNSDIYDLTDGGAALDWYYFPNPAVDTGNNLTTYSARAVRRRRDNRAPAAVSSISVPGAGTAVETTSAPNTPTVCVDVPLVSVRVNTSPAEP